MARIIPARDFMDVPSTQDTIIGNEFSLMNGTKLTGIPKDIQQDPVWPPEEVRNAECELFVRNAHFLMANEKRIFADSRIFLAPVAIRSGMAYTGNFSMPCIGSYLEWWLNYPCSVKCDNGRLALTYFISGSPLSGTNVSMCIREDGRKERSTAHMLTLAHTFCTVVRRYAEARRHFQAYSLEEALGILKDEVVAFENSTQKIMLEQKVKSQEREIRELKTALAEREERICKYSRTLVRMLVRERPNEIRSALAQPNGNLVANTITKIFRAFSKRNGINLPPAPKRILQEELSK